MFMLAPGLQGSLTFFHLGMEESSVWPSQLPDPHVNAVRKQNPKGGEEENKSFVFEAKQPKMQPEKFHKVSAFTNTEWKQS